MEKDGKERLALQVIDTWLDYRARLSDLSGFQICVRNSNKVLFNKAYGYANLNTKMPLTTQHLFHIASQSKTFTSCAILQLIEQGKLNFYQSALDYLPELKNHKDKRFKQITIRDLLSNRSGIFRDGVDCEFWELQKPFPTKDQLIQEVLSSNLIYEPNQFTKYSNIGYALLGLILEKVSGMPYQNVIESLILSKLKGTHILTDYSDSKKGFFADGHLRPIYEINRLPLKHLPTNVLAPATGFCANAEDTNLFFDTLLLGKGLLKKQMHKELMSLNWPVKNATHERYGLGLLFDKFPDMELVGHSGGYPGFSTATIHGLGTEYVISFSLNTNEYIPMRAARSILQIFNKIDLTFTREEARQAILGGPFMTKWGKSLFILTKKKGLFFPLESWAPSEESLLLTSKNGEEYLCDNQIGFGSVGEKIIFTKDKAGNLLSVKWGSFTYMLEKTFVKNIHKALMN